MNRNLSVEQLVGRYLDNEMSQVERLEFENQLIHNSDLKEELSLQKDLIEGIKESRRSELKARLDNIPINSPFYQSIGFKSIVAATITAGIGFGIYFLTDQSSDIPLSPIDLTQNQVLVQDSNQTPEIPEAITPITKSDHEVLIPNNKKAKIEKQQTQSEEVSTEEPQLTEPVVMAPDVVDAFDDVDFESEEINVENQFDNLEKVKEDVESAIEVTTIKDKRNKFHYKFMENKLYPSWELQ
jgi:hypothetical protein